MDDPALRSPAALAYGRLALATLAAVTIVSAAALTVALAQRRAAPRLAPGAPYGDVAPALMLIGGAASAACLASAAAYFAQVALAREAHGAVRALHLATVALMTAGYLAFAAGGLVFSHFALGAASALARPAAAATGR